MSSADIRDFGAVGDGVTDCSQAFRDAIGTMGPAWEYQGGLLSIPEGVFYFSEDLHITRVMVVSGVSGGSGNGKSTLQFAAGNGVVIDGPTTAPDGGKGSFSSLRDLDIICAKLTQTPWLATRNYVVGDRVWPAIVTGYHYLCTVAGQSGAVTPAWSEPDLPGREIVDGTVTWTCVVAPGIYMRARASLRDVWIYEVTDSGVHVQASYAYTPATNANGFSFDNLRVQGCGGHGVLVVGDDASAGVGTGVDIVAVGGHGIYDHCFLGCTWIGPEVAGTGRRSYCLDGGNSRSVIIGGYAEGDTQPALLGPYAVALGGLYATGFDDASAGLVLSPDRTSPLTVKNSRATIAVTSKLGVDDATRTALQISSSDDHPYGLRLKHNGVNRWSWVWANAEKYTAYEITTGRSPLGPAVLCAPKLALGDGTAERVLTYAAAQPTTGFWTRGDRVYTSVPALGGPEGWVCVASGGWATSWSPGTGLLTGAIATPSVPNGKVYRVVGLPGSTTYSGTTGAVEPTWPESLGSTVTDGTLLWSCDGVDASSGAQIFATFGNVGS